MDDSDVDQEEPKSNLALNWIQVNQEARMKKYIGNLKNFGQNGEVSICVLKDDEKLLVDND